MADTYQIERNTITKWVKYHHNSTSFTGTNGRPSTLDESYEKEFLAQVTERQTNKNCVKTAETHVIINEMASKLKMKHGITQIKNISYSTTKNIIKKLDITTKNA